MRRGGTGAGVGRVTQTFQPRGRAAISPVGREKGGVGFGPAVAAFPMSGSARHVRAAKHRFGFCGGSWRSGSPATGCTDSSSEPGRTRPQGLEAKVRRYTGTRCICPALSMRQRGRTARDAQAMDGGCGSCGERIDGCGRFVRMKRLTLEGRCGRTGRRRLWQRSRRHPGG